MNSAVLLTNKIGPPCGAVWPRTCSSTIPVFVEPCQAASRLMNSWHFVRPLLRDSSLSISAPIILSRSLIRGPLPIRLHDPPLATGCSRCTLLSHLPLQRGRFACRRRWAVPLGHRVHHSAGLA